mgnify:CR=1 FL=1
MTIKHWFVYKQFEKKWIEKVQVYIPYKLMNSELLWEEKCKFIDDSNRKQ